MKLQVLHENGTAETLTLSGEWRVHEGQFLNCLVGPGGVVHYFTHAGEYDGWGSGVNETPEAAGQIIDAMEEKREFRSLTD